MQSAQILNKKALPINRRTFMSALSGGLASFTALTSCTGGLSDKTGTLSDKTGGLSDKNALSQSSTQTANQASNQAWQQASAIRRKVTAPIFPNREFLATNFGAIADGTTNNSKAFAAAITHCHEQGGGRVRITKGQFFTGAIHLLSNVNLHLDDGCTLLFSTHEKDYLPAVLTRWEGMELMGLSPLIYAFEQHNIALTGNGILDGQADETHWWPMKGGKWAGGKNWSKEGIATQDTARKQLEKDTENNRPVNERIYAEGAQLRPPFVQFYRSTNILIENITITRAPFWLINPVLCEDVTVRGVTCTSLGPNSDGCDPESCKNVVIENCFFDTGDDCIAIKSGRNADGRRINIPSENIVIRGCKMRNGHGGVVIGSEISGGARNIFVEDCEMSSPELERGIRIKTNSVRGGTIENIYFRNIKIGAVKTAIVIDFGYEEGDTGKFTPTVKNIEIRNVECKNAKKLFNVSGYERSPIHKLALININFIQADDIGVIKNVTDFVTENVTIHGKLFSL